MSTVADDKTRVFESALHWVGRLQNSDAGERAAFFAWLAESPRHVEELNFALALMEEISELTPERRAEIEAMAGHEAGAIEDASQANVIPLQNSAASVAQDRNALRVSIFSRPWLMGLAASIAWLALAAWWAELGPLGWHSYATRIGEQRALTLEDGSLVQLNTRSRLQVRFTAQERELELLEGEALFKVQRDAARPFRVRAHDAVIQAIGTEFNVYLREHGASVSVLEGVVQVAAARVTAGETFNVASSGRIMARKALNPAEAVAWRQRRLVFHDESLAVIAEEFNRYNASLRIRVQGDDARSQRFAGTFDADAPEAFIAALAPDGRLAIERREGEILIRRRE